MSRQRWLLLVALIPMLTFMGHWPRVAIPFSDGEMEIVLIPGDGGHPHSHTATPAAAGQDKQHEQHCHISVGSCSDVPYTGGQTALVLAETIRFLGAADDVLRPLGPTAWRPTTGIALLPDTPPPR